MYLQRGLDLPSLDVTYFTSLSYYILLLFGLRGVFTLWFREETIDETQMYRQQMGMAGGGMPGMDNKKMFEGECSVLEMVCPNASIFKTCKIHAHGLLSVVMQMAVSWHLVP